MLEKFKQKEQANYHKKIIELLNVMYKGEDQLEEQCNFTCTFEFY